MQIFDMILHAFCILAEKPEPIPPHRGGGRRGKNNLKQTFYNYEKIFPFGLFCKYVCRM